MSNGAMLYGPEHALQIAAEAVGSHARSPEMAVGIILGIQACIEEYSRMLTAPDFPPPDSSAETKETPKKDPAKDPAKERVAGLRNS